MDSIIGRYKILLRSKRWYIRIFYHLLDKTVSNSWLIYRRANENTNKKILSSAEFRIEITGALCKIDTYQTNKRGRPSDLEKGIVLKKPKPNTQTLPPKDVRLDGVAHWPS